MDSSGQRKSPEEMATALEQEACGSSGQSAGGVAEGALQARPPSGSLRAGEGLSDGPQAGDGNTQGCSNEYQQGGGSDGTNERTGAEKGGSAQCASNYDRFSHSCRRASGSDPPVRKTSAQAGAEGLRQVD